MLLKRIVVAMTTLLHFNNIGISAFHDLMRGRQSLTRMSYSMSKINFSKALIKRKEIMSMLSDPYSVIPDRKEKTKVKKDKSKKLVLVSQLTEALATDELKSLNNEINKHDKLYYIEAAPEITDGAYDKLLRRAQDIVGRYPQLSCLVDKLQSVGTHFKNTQFDDFNHSIPMKSLDNAFSSEEIDKFCNRVYKCYENKQDNSSVSNYSNVTFVVEPKIDGLSLALRYHYGKLAAAGTRGNGIIGEDVTVNVQAIETIPKFLPLWQQVPLVEVRGEVYITTRDFKELNDIRVQQGEKMFSTPRNAAAGSLRQIFKAQRNSSQGNSSNIHSSDMFLNSRRLRFFAYFMLQSVATSYINQLQVAFPTQVETLQSLKRLGFEVADGWACARSTTEVESSCIRLEQLRSELGFDTDGAVIKVDSVELQQQIGETVKFPRWAIAYKFNAQEAVTKLCEIQVQVGRTGVLTPVAVLQSVVIGGVNVERASLHNAEEVNRLKLFPGASVLVKRAGDVIPKVVRVISANNSMNDEVFQMPRECPVCGSLTEAEEDGIIVRCSGGLACPAQAIEAIRHFCSRDAADIVGLGPARVEELYNAGIVKEISDLYLLRSKDLLGKNSDNDSSINLRGRDGWGDRSVNNLLSAIDARTKLSFPRFLYGLGIRHVGLGTATLISQRFVSFDKFWTYLTKQADDLTAKTTNRDVDVSELYCNITNLSPLTIRKRKPKVIKTKGKENEVSRETEWMGELLAIQGIGEKATTALAGLALNPSQRRVVTDLLRQVAIHDVPTANTSSLVRYADLNPDSADGTNKSTESTTSDLESNKLDGRVLVFTGKLLSITRVEAQRLAESKGALVVQSMTKKVNLVVAGEEGLTTTKITKATAKGLEIWDERQFLQTVGVLPASEDPMIES